MEGEALCALGAGLAGFFAGAAVLGRVDKARIARQAFRASRVNNLSDLHIQD